MTDPRPVPSWAVASRLVDGGRFVIECFVPEDPPRHGDAVTVAMETVGSVTNVRVTVSNYIYTPVTPLAPQSVQTAVDQPATGHLSRRPRRPRGSTCSSPRHSARA